MSGPARVRDVAAAASVSVGVASVVLRGATTSTIRVGKAARERVWDAALRLGYVPNAAAQALRTGKTMAIGVAVRELRHPFFVAIVDAIDAACRREGYHLLLGHARGDEHEEQAIVGLLSGGRSDGLLVVGEIPGDEPAIRAVQARGTPLVLVARPPLAGLPAVTIDHQAALKLALDHLAALGHRQVALALYSDERVLPLMRDRLTGATEYASRRGWPAPLHFSAEDAAAGRLGPWLRAAIAADPPLTAIIANDTTSIAVLKAAQACGIAVPAQLSILAMDGTELTTYTTPELTAVTPPLASLGEAAARLLLDRLRTPDCPPAQPPTLRLQATLTTRASTAPACPALF